MAVRILGICGSPVKDSNTQRLLADALDSIAAEEVQTELVALHDKTIHDCVQCNWCLTKQKDDQYCAFEDDMAPIYPKILAADGLLMATPVYLARVSGLMAALLDRMRALDYGKRAKNALRHKIGAGIAVSWYRNSGIETTLTSIHWAYHNWQMIVATPGSRSTFGGGGVSSIGGSGNFDPAERHHVLSDDFGVESARATAASLVELAKIVKAGRAALK